MEITAWDIFKYFSHYRIQPVQTKMQKSVVNRRNCEVHVIRNVSTLVQWDMTYLYYQWFRWKEPRVRFPYILVFYCVVNVPIWPMVQMEITAWELSVSSNIYLCGQRTNTTDGSDGNISAQELFRSCNISLCGKHTDKNDGQDGKSSASYF